MVDSRPPIRSISKRVFLVACPRSGTTLLQSLLMAHPRIQSFPETHFFSRLFGGRLSRAVSLTGRGLYGWLLLLALQRSQQVRMKDAIRDTPLHFSRSAAAQEFSVLMDRWTLSTGKDVWLEKTPGHLEFIPNILASVPTPIFVHLVRDGRAVVASLYRLAGFSTGDWDRYKNLDAAIDRWNRSIRLTGEYVGRERHLVVRFEDLVLRPTECLGKLCRSLDVDYDPRMLTSYHDAALRVVRGDEYWKKQNFDPVLKSDDKCKYEAAFDETQRAYIEGRLDWRSYHHLGFERAWS